MRHLLVAALFLLAVPAWGEGYWSAGWAYSNHYLDGYREDGEVRDFNESHAALGFHNESVDAYLFSNSFHDPSLAVGKRFARRWHHYEVELYLAGVVGYKDRLKSSYGGISPFGWVGVSAYFGPRESLSIQVKANADFTLVGFGKRF